MGNKIEDRWQIDLEEQARIVMRYLKERSPVDMAKDIRMCRSPVDAETISTQLLRSN